MSLEEAIEFIDTHPDDSPLAHAAQVLLTSYQNLQQHMESAGHLIDDISESLKDVIED